MCWIPFHGHLQPDIRNILCSWTRVSTFSFCAVADSWLWVFFWLFFLVVLGGFFLLLLWKKVGNYCQDFSLSFWEQLMHKGEMLPSLKCVGSVDWVTRAVLGAFTSVEKHICVQCDTCCWHELLSAACFLESESVSLLEPDPQILCVPPFKSLT